MKITYDSWQEQYKNPFGAVKAGNTVKWSIKIDQVIQGAVLWLTKSRETPVAYPMNYDEQTKMYTTQVKIGTSGLYNYYFTLQQNNQIVYIDQGLFGKGHITKSDHDLRQFQLTCYDIATPRIDWYQKGIVYQIFPDRFANGNPHEEVIGKKRNSFIYATKEDIPYYIKNSEGAIVRWDFFGGNLTGIRKKIPYLKQLGVTVLYLNPIFLAKSNHRYDTTDFMKIDPMLGDEKDLADLIRELHENNMHLILDGVFNHVGFDSIYFQGAITDKNSNYRSWFNFQDYPNKYQSWWGVKSLPTVNKDNSEYQNLVYGDHGVLAKWKVDGWRLDVADELPIDFLRNIRTRLIKENCPILIGEVWEDASNKFVNGEYRTYTAGDNLMGVMNYPIRNFIISLLSAQDSTIEIEAMNDLALLVENYPTDFLHNCLNNIGTHDTLRIKTVLNKNDNLVMMAFGLLFMMPGVPCIYYGDEAGLIGKEDPDNRRYFPWGHEDKKLIDCVSSWTKIRKQNPVLVNGKIGFVHLSAGVNSIVRYNDQEMIMYCVNCTNEDVIPLREKYSFYWLPSIIIDKIKDTLDQIQLKAQTDFIKKISL